MECIMNKKIPVMNNKKRTTFEITTELHTMLLKEQSRITMKTGKKIPFTKLVPMLLTQSIEENAKEK